MFPFFFWYVHFHIAGARPWQRKGALNIFLRHFMCYYNPKTKSLNQ